MGYFKWINCIKSIFNDVVLGFIFSNQKGFIDVKYISQNFARSINPKVV